MPNDASTHTQQAQRAVRDELPFDDTTDFDLASKGLISRGETVIGDTGAPVWDASRFSFVTGDAPDTVNPSLWRQSRLILETGLFNVVDRV